MRFSEASRLARQAERGEELAFLLAMSGTTEPLAVYLRAAGAERGRAVQARTLPFNTLGQVLREPPRDGEIEVFVLCPWDLIPEADWRSGVPMGAADASRVREGAEQAASLLGNRPRARILYLPAPTLPLWSDPPRNAALACWLEGLVRGLGGEPLAAEMFSLRHYLWSGFPIAGTHLGAVARAIVSAACQPPEPAKVLVTDLDNTLWSGVVADEGPGGVACGPDGIGYRHFIYQTFLARLRREGVLLAAVTRNDPEVALAALRTPGMTLGESDFIAVLASYGPKSAQVAALSTTLNIGLQAFVFVDDNPVELDEVRRQVPEVACLAFPGHDDSLPEFLASLTAHFHRTEVTAEDAARTELYRRRLAGMVPVAASESDRTGFLRDLAMTLTLHDRSVGDRSRALQLINKTNQFNLNGRRITDDDVAGTVACGGRLYTASLDDRTGSHGEILACLLDRERVVRSLVMSCRVFQRRVEHAFVAWLASLPDAPVALDFRRTERNTPLVQFLTDIAAPVDDGGLVSFDARRIASSVAAARGLFRIVGP